MKRASGCERANGISQMFMSMTIMRPVDSDPVPSNETRGFRPGAFPCIFFRGFRPAWILTSMDCDPRGFRPPWNIDPRGFRKTWIPTPSPQNQDRGSERTEFRTHGVQNARGSERTGFRMHGVQNARGSECTKKTHGSHQGHNARAVKRQQAVKRHGRSIRHGGPPKKMSSSLV